MLSGIALARRMHQRLAQLPTEPRPGGTHVTPFLTDCNAPCPVCGEEYNCGHLQITNTWAELTLDLSYQHLHYLAHGSFAVSATERLDPVLLDALLRPAVLIAVGASDVTLRWMSKPGQQYQIFTAPAVAGPWIAGPIFPGDGTELVVTAAKPAGADHQFYKVVGW